jgi:integrase
MPNRIAFTQLAIDRLKPPPIGRAVYWDKLLPGFGLRVSAPRPGSRDGRKTWIAMGRVDGRAVMVTLATTAQVPQVGRARDAARAALLKMKGGTNPVAERRAERDRKEADAAAEAQAAREAEEGRFAVVAERFLAERGRAAGWAPRYAAEVRRILEHDVLPRWGDRTIRSITKHDVNELLDGKASGRERARAHFDGGATIQANRDLMRLRTLFAWAVAQGLVDTNPTAGVLARGRERTRDRVLDDAEIVRFWRAAGAIGWPYGPIFRLLLLTAQRESEVAGMAWREVEGRTWTIPRERTKSDRAHTVHISALAAEILEALPHTGELVFGSSPPTGFSNAKAKLDGLMGDGAPWVLHDLRRSACSTMARLNVPPHVVDKILNHQSGAIRGVAAVYNRFQYIDERRAALEALGRFVAGLVQPGGAGNVITLRADISKIH